LCYRKYGHNEGDEPRFTQPLLYKAIEKHPDPRVIYVNKLVNEGVCSEDELAESERMYNEFLEQKLEKAREIKKVSIPQFLKEEWKGFRYSDAPDFDIIVATGVKKNLLKKLAGQIFNLPADKKFFKKITR